MNDAEFPLSGGNITSVVRIGNTVRRVMGPWSPAVHGLLRHLERRGFTGAPQLLGIDEQGREILSFLPGEVGFLPYMWSEEALVAAARLLRQFHDATVGYTPPSGASWQFVYPDVQRHEVICHNDFAPYNLVFVDEQPQAIIDFDSAGPGPRMWDVAWAVFWFVPLVLSGELQALALADLAMGSRRLRLFCDTYGLEQRQDLPGMVEQRLQCICTMLIARASVGDAAYQKLINEGHLAGYQRDLATFRQYRATLEQSLSRVG